VSLKLTEISVDDIDPPEHSHRVDFDEDAMLQLMASIGELGLLNPIHVRRAGERYEIIAGHRRWEAHRRLRRLTIPTFVVARTTDTNVERARFAENLQRADLTPMEEAAAIDQAMRDCTLDEPAIARALNHSPAWVRARLELLTLSAEVQTALHQKTISTGAALALGEVDDDAHRAYLLEHAVRNGASIAVLRSWVAEYITQRAAAGGAPLPPPDPSQPPARAVVLMECWACHQPHDHATLQIVRICIPCMKELQR
jgi:ParB family chromosome partitioning protein